MAAIADCPHCGAPGGVHQDSRGRRYCLSCAATWPTQTPRPKALLPIGVAAFVLAGAACVLALIVVWRQFAARAAADVAATPLPQSTPSEKFASEPTPVKVHPHDRRLAEFVAHLRRLGYEQKSISFQPYQFSKQGKHGRISWFLDTYKSTGPEEKFYGRTVAERPLHYDQIDELSLDFPPELTDELSLLHKLLKVAEGCYRADVEGKSVRQPPSDVKITTRNHKFYPKEEGRAGASDFDWYDVWVEGQTDSYMMTARINQQIGDETQSAAIVTLTPRQ